MTKAAALVFGDELHGETVRLVVYIATLGESYRDPFEVGTTHAEALNRRNPVFASDLLRCVGLIRQAAEIA